MKPEECIIDANTEDLELSPDYLMHLKVAHSVETSDDMPQPGFLYIMKNFMIFHQMKKVIDENKMFQAFKKRFNSNSDKSSSPRETLVLKYEEISSVEVVKRGFVPTLIVEIKSIASTLGIDKSSVENVYDFEVLDVSLPAHKFSRIGTVGEFEKVKSIVQNFKFKSSVTPGGDNFAKNSDDEEGFVLIDDMKEETSEKPSDKPSDEPPTDRNQG
mmetsp:Transcript_32796/g.50067  ORF Transcript_32796/g.50067 Transcript_32796/m.50067 type:complete len:215 (+) Transcript_32796:161-805(+)